MTQVELRRKRNLRLEVALLFDLWPARHSAFIRAVASSISSPISRWCSWRIEIDVANTDRHRIAGFGGGLALAFAA